MYECSRYIFKNINCMGYIITVHEDILADTIKYLRFFNIDFDINRLNRDYLELVFYIKTD
jgi:hypothetical protein